MTIDSVRGNAQPRLLKGRPGLPVIVGLIVLTSLVLHLIAELPHDTSWLLSVCERMLAGQRLYSEIAELNPPMSAWLYLPWVAFAHAIGVAPETVVVVVTLVVGLAAIAASARILDHGALPPKRSVWWIVAAFTMLVVPMLTFAQREHFAVMFILPMLAAIAVRAEGRALSWVYLLGAGLGGGLAVAVKPQFGLAILLPVAYAAVRQRSLRPVFAIEVLVAGAAFLAYLGAAARLHPEYLSEMLPIATAIYVPNRLPISDVLTRPATIVSAILIVAWIVNGSFRRHPLQLVLLLATIGFVLAYLIQGRGWAYHALPVLTLASIGLGLSFWSRPVDRGGEWSSNFSCIAITLVALLPAATFFQAWLLDRPLANALRPLGPGLKIALLSNDLAIGSPVHRMVGGMLINRGPSLWLAGNALQFCARGSEGDRQETCKAMIGRERQWLREDLTRTPPDVILADARRFDWLEWAREDPATAAILDGYVLFATVGSDPSVNRIFVRTDR